MDLIRIHLERCIICGGSLHGMKNKIVTADVLYLDGFRKVQHQAKRCNIKRCRLIYWNNYAWIGKKKIGTVALGDIQEIFVTDKTGFSKDFFRVPRGP